MTMWFNNNFGATFGTKASFSASSTTSSTSGSAYRLELRVGMKNYLFRLLEHHHL